MDIGTAFAGGQTYAFYTFTLKNPLSNPKLQYHSNTTCKPLAYHWLTTRWTLSQHWVDTQSTLGGHFVDSVNTRWTLIQHFVTLTQRNTIKFNNAMFKIWMGKYLLETPCAYQLDLPRRETHSTTRGHVHSKFSSETSEIP